MPNKITIEVDGKRVSIDKPMTEAEAREWMFDQAVRLTTREPIVIDKRRGPSIGV